MCQSTQPWPLRYSQDTFAIRMWTVPLNKTSWSNLGAPNVPGHGPCQQMTEQCPAHRATTSVVSDPRQPVLHLQTTARRGSLPCGQALGRLRSSRRFGSKRFPPSVPLQIWLTWPSHAFVSQLGAETGQFFKVQVNANGTQHGVFQAVKAIANADQRGTWAVYIRVRNLLGQPTASSQYSQDTKLEQGMVGYTQQKTENDTLKTM